MSINAILVNGSEMEKKIVPSGNEQLRKYEFRELLTMGVVLLTDDMVD